MKKQTTALVILDGFGLRDDLDGNAIRICGAPNVYNLMQKYPSSELITCGLDVGLPKGQMGNSEVGHLNIGAGRIIYQELTRISKSIEDGDFFEKAEFLQAAKYVRRNGSKLHLMGLVSDGGVHSTMEHIYALLEFAKRQEISDVFVHCFLDGRDTPPTSGLGFLKDLQSQIDKIGVGKIATVSGRFYAMDRDNRWERVEKAYDMLSLGKGAQANDFVTAIQSNYDNGTTDEFVVPTVIVQDGKPVATVENGDAVIFFNFRPDRAREMTRVFTQSGFSGFDLTGKQRSVCWVCMTQYDESFCGIGVAFKPEKYQNTLGEYLSKAGKKQVRIAETEKYAHVTFFFNGGVEAPNSNEDRVLVPSKKEFATYDLVPEMSAREAMQKAVEAIESGKYDVVILNLANCDMVGHTGVLNAAVKAVKTVDDCVKILTECIIKNDGRMFLTADHGNAEKMFDDCGGAFTAHTLSNVPFVLVDERLKDTVELDCGRLCDIAPTMLSVMGMPIPPEMSGRILLRKKC